MDEIHTIKEELKAVKDLFLKVTDIIPSFNVTDPSVLPYGLKPHTRSISWIAEQVITQQAKFHRKRLEIQSIDIDMPDTCLHDCIVIKNSRKKFYVNIKITNAETRANKNDIAAVEKLYMQYKSNQNYRLNYAVFGVKFNNTEISFCKKAIYVFSPQFIPIYVNPRNDKIQSYYQAEIQERSRESFLTFLQQESKSIVLE
ncbi:MAG: hypothetical protein OXH36_00860 [Bdellovibrionales bacterium]|nr:hypothetical protein [Bdellovibrionales bacterium]